MQTGNVTKWDMTDTLAAIVDLAWSTFIGSDIVHVDDRDLGADVICSSIAISGPSNATVLFFAQPDLAREGASTVLDIPLGDLVDADVHDVMGELVNIIGGNLKGAVSDGDEVWGLSLPVVSNAMQHAPGGRLGSAAYFLAAGGAIGCQILEHH